jgi:hypothetical protein
MKKNTVKLTESKLKQIIRESIENYIKENEDVDWGEFDEYDEFDDFGDYEWDGKWAGTESSGEDYYEDPSSEEMIWKHFGNQNIHKDTPGYEGVNSILAQGDKNTFARHIARSVRPTNADYENELYKDWGGFEDDTDDDKNYLKSKVDSLNESKITKMVYESVKRKLRRIK